MIYYTVYADYLEREKGFTFTRLKSLPDAIATFAAMKRADGVTPLIKGLVKYPATYWLGGEDYACMKMGRYNARYAGGVPENFSFWQWVPQSAARPLRPGVRGVLRTLV